MGLSIAVCVHVHSCVYVCACANDDTRDAGTSLSAVFVLWFIDDIHLIQNII